MTGRVTAMRAFSGLAALMLAMPPVAAETAITWETLAGPWRGEGLLRENPGADLQRGVCRVEVTGESAESLTFAGRCANATKSARFRTRLSREDKSGTVRAVTQSRLYPDEVTLVGKETARRMQLRSTEPVTIRGRVYTVHLDIEYRRDKDRFSMVQMLKDIETGVSANVLEMAFRKK